MSRNQAGKRILMTGDAVGGVWTYALELARALQPHGIEISLATMGKPANPSQRAEVRSIKNLTLYESEFKLEWMENPWSDVDRAGEWLLNLKQKIQPDIIHLNGYVHGALSWHSPVIVVGHSCILSWWQAVKGLPVPPDFAEYSKRVKNGIECADLIIAPSHAMLTTLENNYGDIKHKAVIPNGREPSLFNLEKKDKFIFAAGRVWDEGKNIKILSELALNWPIFVAGDTTHPSGESIDLEGLRILGNLPPTEVASFMSRASIYALPALYEPFGLSVLEAALAGCALVLGDILSLRENWDGAAVFVPPNNANSIRSAITKLIEDSNYRKTMSQRARERALTFSPNRMATGYIDAYARAMMISSEKRKSTREAVTCK